MKLLSYLKNRQKAWQEYYHLKNMPDRLLEDIGIEREELKKIRKGLAIR